mmetsp:Transcript_41627/g.82133  ORF Transcript_41627/g.82133 Transcript_41627/m.82133 type:complete len:209 (-) Transcript_41627:267-893(-)
MSESLVNLPDIRAVPSAGAPSPARVPVKLRLSNKGNPSSLSTTAPISASIPTRPTLSPSLVRDSSRTRSPHRLPSLTTSTNSSMSASVRQKSEAGAWENSESWGSLVFLTEGGEKLRFGLRLNFHLPLDHGAVVVHEVIAAHKFSDAAKAPLSDRLPKQPERLIFLFPHTETQIDRPILILPPIFHPFEETSNLFSVQRQIKCADRGT